MEPALLTTAALAAACLLDYLVGDPPRVPHPVRLLGKVIAVLEQVARRLFVSPRGLKFAGAVIVMITAGGFTALTLGLLAAVYRLHPAAGVVLQIYIFYAMLAGGDLRRHVARVDRHLAQGNLEQARAGTALLVGRDTVQLDQSGLARAALESLFENSSDGLVAPLFYAAIGGPAAAVFYKAVNTMDSMLGHKTKENIDLGFFAAKTDDILNFIPARLTALLLILAGALSGRWKNSLRVLSEDCRKHESPNSAWPEAAAAGVLGLKFGGTVYYRGEVKKRPLINAAGREPAAEDILRGMTLFGRTSQLAFMILILLAYWFRTWEALPF